MFYLFLQFHILTFILNNIFFSANIGHNKKKDHSTINHFQKTTAYTFLSKKY